MLDAIEARRTTEKFGVSAEQVRRDHLMSHLLAALSCELADQIIFFGGTALARSHLPDGRLSEDLDLLAINRRADVVQQVERVLSEAVRREFGRLEWRPRLRDIPDTAPATLRSADGLTVRVQLLDPIGFPIGQPNLLNSSSVTAMRRPRGCWYRRVQASPRPRPRRGTTAPLPEICTTCGDWYSSARSMSAQLSASSRKARQVDHRDHGCFARHRRWTPGYRSLPLRRGLPSGPPRRSVQYATPGTMR